MRKNLVMSLLVGLVLILSTSANLLAKSDDFGNGGVLQPEVIPVAFPEVEVEVIDVVIPADLRLEVTFSVHNSNELPLDIDGVFTPGEVSLRWYLTWIPIGEEQKLSYTIIYGDSTRDSGGEYTTIEQGYYVYKFGTVLPADYEMDATHTLGIVARRDLRDEYDFGRYHDNVVYDFVPSGGTPMPRDIVTTDTCNRCHEPLAFHGGSTARYREVGICAQCHNPSLDVAREKDPEDSVSLDAMIHRVHMEIHGYPPLPEEGRYDCEVCHTGGTPTTEFPMVANPSTPPVCDGSGKSMTTLSWEHTGPVEIRLGSADGRIFATGGPSGSVETGKWVTDGLNFVLVDKATGDEVQELAVDNTVFGCAGNPPGTFRGEAAEQHTRWMTRPSRRVCGSCHEDIDFENGEGHIAQSNDDNCTMCHQADSGEEYDLSVNGAHQVPYKSAQLPGVLVQIEEIKFTEPGSRPLVTFSLRDKFGPLDPTTLNRLRIALTGPNDDFDFYVQEDVLAGLMQSGTNWSYRFDAEIPDDASGSYSIGFEGRITNVPIEGDHNEFTMSDQMQNFIVPVAVTDDEAEARDMIVKDGTCENCHSNLSLHGENRHDASGYCQTCHKADATDVNRRPADGEDQSIHFKYMIHKIHRGEDLARGYVVYGYGNREHDYSHVEYPRDLRECEACHEDGTYNLPLPMGRLDTVAPQDFWSPMMPEAAACLSCHDGAGAAAHAANNTGEFGEACAACHGEGSTFSVEEVHSRP